MKNLFFILVVVALFGLFLFKTHKSAPEENMASKFFDQSQILPTDTVIKVTQNGFEPAEVNIKKGDRVVWVNENSGYVWPASDPHPTHGGYPGFDPEEPFQKGEAWAFIFDKVGTWSYHDHLSPGHTGVIHTID